jgi:hypothetical protein
MAETDNILAWTLISECPIPNDVNDLLVEGEVAIAAYKTLRDSAIFTNKRLIVRDAQVLQERRLRSIHYLTPPLICGPLKMPAHYWI